jgi:hypothetical protein
MKKIENLSKEIKAIKKNQLEILELKSIMTKMKSSSVGLMAEWRGEKKERINEQEADRNRTCPT